MTLKPNEGTAALWRIIGLLDKVKRSGSGWEASCPGPRHKHQDKKPSLSIGLGYDSRVLLNCKTGCDVEEILGSLGLTFSDLFEKSQAGNPVRRFRLIAPNGNVVAEHVREDLVDDKKLWWEHDGQRGLNGTQVVDLPLYRAPSIALADPKAPVIVCEGEKAAEALADVGLLAVATVTGANKTPSDASLAVLQGREVWLWPDNDDLGREHMAKIATRIQPAPKWIKWSDAPEKGDAADFLLQGGQITAIPSMVHVPDAIKRGPLIWTGDQLARARFDPVRWAIPGILPSGLTILAGRPKLGKSWLVLGWALDVPRGSLVLRKIETEPGETLYLALEDSFRRMQERQAMMLGDVSAPRGFNVATEWPRQDEGGLDEIERWLDHNQNARLVIIDTFKRFRPKESKIQRLYDLDYDAVAPVAALAARRNIAIVLVFHTNKSDPADPVDLVSGTLGLSGAADGVLVLKRERGQADASLFVTGRDVEEQDLALKWERDDLLGWALLGNADNFRVSKERAQLLEVITAVPGMKPAEIAHALGKTSGAVRQLLFKMVNEGDVRLRDTGYYPVVKEPTTSNNGNSSNSGDALTPHTAHHPVTSVTAVTPVIGVTAVTAQVTCRRCGRDKATHGNEDPVNCRWLADEGLPA